MPPPPSIGQYQAIVAFMSQECSAMIVVTMMPLHMAAKNENNRFFSPLIPRTIAVISIAGNKNPDIEEMHIKKPIITCCLLVILNSLIYHTRYSAMDNTEGHIGCFCSSKAKSNTKGSAYRWRS